MLYNLAFVFLKVVLNVAFVVVAAPVIGTVGIAAIVFEEVKMHRGRRALREWSIFALIFEDDSCYVGVGLTQSFWNPPHIARASWPCEPDPRALVLATMSGTDRDAQAEVLAWMWAAHTAG